MNEVINVLTKNTKGLKTIKNGKVVKNDCFSVKINLTTEISNRIHEELNEISSLFLPKTL